MTVSTPCVARNAVVSDSANRFASSYTDRGPTGFACPQYDSGCGWTSGSPYTSELEATRNRAPCSLARPSACSVPTEPTCRVSIGSRR